MKNGLAERGFSIGLWAWLMLVEQESDKLSESGQVALEFLREDLEKMASGKCAGQARRVAARGRVWAPTPSRPD